VTFPIYSTSVMTPACGRVCRVMQRVAREGLISYGGVFSCRRSRARTTGASTPGATRWTCSPLTASTTTR
jgi:hypothetical protein